MAHGGGWREKWQKVAKGSKGMSKDTGTNRTFSIVRYKVRQLQEHATGFQCEKREGVGEREIGKNGLGAKYRKGAESGGRKFGAKKSSSELSQFVIHQNAGGRGWALKLHHSNVSTQERRKGAEKLRGTGKKEMRDRKREKKSRVRVRARSSPDTSTTPGVLKRNGAKIVTKVSVVH